MSNEEERLHISYSKYRFWRACPYKYKLVAIDKIEPFEENVYFAFGAAIHSLCEQKYGNIEKKKTFTELFLAELNERQVEIEPTEQVKMIKQAAELEVELFPAIEEHFGKFKVKYIEVELKEPIENYSVDFWGYIDLVIQTEDGQYHILDWKSTSWGWHARKKSDPIWNYQLTYYKIFFAQCAKIPLENIKTYFVFLKRTAKLGKKIEIFHVTSGKKKIENAMESLRMMVSNISCKRFMRNRLGCDTCDFHGTKHCT